MNLKKQDWFQIGAYIGVSVLAVSAAFLISLSLLGRSSAQDGAELPPLPATGETPAQDNPPTLPPPPPPTGEIPPEPTATAPSVPDPNNAPVSAEQAATNAGIAELEGFLEPFIYDVVNRRDPFQPYAEYMPADEANPRAISPAQRFDIDQLKLVGVMWDVKDPKAMFVDPQQEVLVLGRDESIGNKNGYIAAIREGEVVVVEAIRKRGDIIYRTRVLRIER